MRGEKVWNIRGETREGTKKAFLSTFFQSLLLNCFWFLNFGSSHYLKLSTFSWMLSPSLILWVRYSLFLTFWTCSLLYLLFLPLHTFFCVPSHTFFTSFFSVPSYVFFCSLPHTILVKLFHTPPSSPVPPPNPTLFSDVTVPSFFIDFSSYTTLTSLHSPFFLQALDR